LSDRFYAPALIRPTSGSDGSCHPRCGQFRGKRCMDSHSSDAFRLSSAARVQARTQRPLLPTAGMKARQSSKIRELAEAVKSAGFLTLDEQAKALGLSRSTAWTIRKASHKASGLRSSIVCWPRRSCHRLPEPRSSNKSRKKPPAYTAAAGVNTVGSRPGFQSRICRYARKLNLL
jgi:hypothetical protein